VVEIPRRVGEDELVAVSFRQRWPTPLNHTPGIRERLVEIQRKDS
jgi:hypothetical protein